jgi:5'-nucleotidase
MKDHHSNRLVVGISSRALFDLTESNAIFEKNGIDYYSKHQIENENTILKPGVAFNLVKKLLNLNIELKENWVEVILLSRNSADTGLRVFNSIKHYGLNITRAAFTSGRSPYRYLSAFGAHLFLSANPEDVESALNAGYAAATILPSSQSNSDSGLLKIAFDGDAVIFSDEAEKIYQQQGLAAFNENEISAAKHPLQAGPFKGFLAALHELQKKFSADSCPIRTALVTARQAPSHERVILTLRNWNIRIDEAFFLGGLNKSEFLASFKADIFFDDQQGHCQLACQWVPTGHVPSGVTNEGK